MSHLPLLLVPPLQFSSLYPIPLSSIEGKTSLRTTQLWDVQVQQDSEHPFSLMPNLAIQS